MKPSEGAGVGTSVQPPEPHQNTNSLLPTCLHVKDNKTIDNSLYLQPVLETQSFKSILITYSLNNSSLAKEDRFAKKAKE